MVALLLVSLLISLALSSADARRRAGAAERLADPLGTDLERLALVFRPFLAFAAVALFGFFMGILLNEGLRGFTKTG